jgi:hypothetical protein
MILALLAMTGCTPTPDSKGRNPADVVGLFVKAVNSKDFATAKIYWEHGAVSAIEFMADTNFNAFCEQRFRCISYSTSQPRKQKMDFWSLAFLGDRTNRYVFYLHQVGGEWKLHYSRGM